LCETNEHFYASDDRIKSSIIGAIDDERIMESFESITSCMRQMNMTKKRDDIESRYSHLQCHHKCTSDQASVMFPENRSDHDIFLVSMDEREFCSVGKLYNIVDGEIAFFGVTAIP
jgi:hypothetical protein